MAVPTYNITINAFDGQGNPVVAATDKQGNTIDNVIIKLNAVDLDTALGEYVYPEVILAATDQNGQAVVKLWPNVRGSAGSQYRVKVINPQGGDKLDVMATVQESDNLLSEIAETPPPVTRSAISLATDVAQGYAADSKNWATKTDNLVESTDNSSKSWAIGGTGAGRPSAGPAKDWAIETVSTVDGSEYSSKEYAQGTQPGTGGSAKSWAQTVGAYVTGSLASAKEWAIGTLLRGTAGGGSAKDWANYTGGTVDDTEFSAKKYAQDSETAETNAAASAADAAASAAKLQGTSTSSVAIGTGSKAFTTQSDKFFDPGTFLLIVSDSGEGNYMTGQVTAYSGTSLTVDIAHVGGSGTHADWNIFVAGRPGDKGTKGDTGAPGVGSIEAFTGLIISGPATSISDSEITFSWNSTPAVETHEFYDSGTSSTDINIPSELDGYYFELTFEAAGISGLSSGDYVYLRLKQGGSTVIAGEKISINGFNTISVSVNVGALSTGSPYTLTAQIVGSSTSGDIFAPNLQLRAVSAPADSDISEEIVDIVNGGCAVANRPSVSLSSILQIGKVERFGCYVDAASSVDAGTIDHSSSAPIGKTGNSLHLSGVSLTGTNSNIYVIYRMPSADAKKWKNRKAVFQALVHHNVGVNIDYAMAVAIADAQDDFSSTTIISGQGDTNSVPSEESTKIINDAITDLGDCSNGLEISIQVHCGEVTLKDFYFTEFQLDANKLDGFRVKPYHDELLRCREYYRNIKFPALSAAGASDYRSASAQAGYMRATPSVSHGGTATLVATRGSDGSVLVYQDSDNTSNAILDVELDAEL